MRDGSLIVCDACKVDEMMREPDVITRDLWPGDGWVKEPWRGGDMDFCPRHASPERRALLAEGFLLTCASCGRTSKDPTAPKQWWIVRDSSGQRSNLCADCHEAASGA